MSFNPFHVTPANIAYSCLGGFTVFFGMFSLLIREKLYIGEAIWAFLFGIAIGPYGAHIFSPRDWGGGDAHVTEAITLEVTRVVLAVGVFAIGVELPSKYMKENARSLLFLLGPIMAIGWIVCAGLIYAMIPPLDFVSSLAIAACLTPTDPILAAAVVGGKYAEKHVPEHLRHLLYAESGCNDGAAFPFLFIALYIILEADDRVAVAKWFYITWAYEIALGIIIGSLIGFGFRHLLKFCEDRDLIDRKSYVAQYISLALLSNGITALLGSDDLLAAFASGTAFAWDSHFNKQTRDSVFSSVIDLLFNVAIFVYIGAWMPFGAFDSVLTGVTVWRLTVLAILIILLRRLPIMIMLYKWIPGVKTFREALFSGHFGPMGVGAIFIATLAVERLPHPEEPPRNQTDILALSIEPIIAFTVMCSILIHGLSIPFFSLGRRVHSVTMSRTLSLRSHQADWLSNMRKVTRPEDIVINRDREPEPISATEKEMEEGRVGTLDSETGAAKAAEQALDYEYEENDELVRKWREGRHLVIEHHSKEPGTEVQVEVIHDAFEERHFPDLKNTVHRFKAAPQSIRDEVLKYLHSFPRGSTDDRAVAPSQELVEPATGKTSRPSSTSSKTSKSSKKGRGMKIATPSEVNGSQVPSVVADDENDEWEDEPVSEASEPDAEPLTLPPKKKQHHATKGRRRESFRRSALARHAVAIAVQPQTPSDSGDAAGPEPWAIPPPTPLRNLGQRPVTHIRGGSDDILIPPGDPSGLPRPTLHSHGSGSGLRSRFDRLKGDEMGGFSSRAGTRESSPARVIRFAKQSPPERTPARTAPPSDDEYTPPSPAPGNTQPRYM